MHLTAHSLPSAARIVWVLGIFSYKPRVCRGNERAAVFRALFSAMATLPDATPRLFFLHSLSLSLSLSLHAYMGQISVKGGRKDEEGGVSPT